MQKVKRTPAGAAFTELILEMFRLNSRVLAAGDRLVAELGLTSARWQILGTIARTDRSQPVSWLARDLGAARQNVQRIVNDLAQEGLVAFAPNPHHRRASLVVLTDKGRSTYWAAKRLQAPWANKITGGLQAKDLEMARNVMIALRQRLERDLETEE
jgi:DNA-binding MarR family transcriptional regulator